MLTDKQIMKAQRVLRKLDATPVKLTRGDGVICFQVTYDNTTYNELLSVLNDVASEPLRCQAEPIISIADYHREKV